MYNDGHGNRDFVFRYAFDSEVECNLLHADPIRQKSGGTFKVGIFKVNTVPLSKYV